MDELTVVCPECDSAAQHSFYEPLNVVTFDASSGQCTCGDCGHKWGMMRSWRHYYTNLTVEREQFPRLKKEPD